MARGIIVVGGIGREVHTIGKKRVEHTVNVPSSKTSENVISFVINKTGQILVIPAMTISKQPSLVITLPSPFPYQSNQAVPWKYGGIVTSNSNQGILAKEEPAANIVGPGGVTRSGRVYLPTNDKRANKGKGIIIESSKNLGIKESDPADEEFLRIMKQSEYDVIEQLRKTPARISILSLIMSSKAHRQALQKVLDEAFVQPDITPEKVASVMNVAKSASAISFSEEEIVESSVSQAKALYITLKCQGFIIAKVLIDGGSALNVLPLTTLKQLSVEESSIKSCDMTVRAFDGSRREVIGTICLPLEIGPSMFIVEFQVMDIEPSYTMLLGRPWIHAARAVPSTLHQKVKFVNNGSIITVKGEEELIMSKPSSVPYIETAEQIAESTFQSLEIEKPKEPKMNVNVIVTKILEKNGFQSGKGLGAQLQGIAHPLHLSKNPNRQGLGYKPALEDQMKEQASLEGNRKMGKREIPHIHETFPALLEVMNSPSILMIAGSNGEPQGRMAYVSRDTIGTTLDNWELENIPDIIALE